MSEKAAVFPRKTWEDLQKVWRTVDQFKMLQENVAPWKQNIKK